MTSSCVFGSRTSRRGSVADRYKRLQRKILHSTGIASRGRRDEIHGSILSVLSMLGEHGIGPNVVQEPFCQARSQSFKRWRKRLVAWILHLSATDPVLGTAPLRLESSLPEKLLALRGVSEASYASAPKRGCLRTEAGILGKRWQLSSRTIPAIYRAG